ncbi:hypothetical protein [Rhizobium sp.]|uniref:hypothetical protein n=1 Tax=Rhizobium sp. TaxID=391 RepID=UPI0028B05377
MALPLRDYVQQVLIERDRASQIHAAVHNAWQQTKDKYPERGRWVRKSTFRGLMWEAAVRELEKIGHDDPDFSSVFHCDTASFVIEQAVLFRFKHADAALTTANYPTAEAVAFDDHEVDLWGFKGLQRVELCYVLDEFETSVIWVGVAARLHGKFLWKIELDAAGIATPLEGELFREDVDASKLARIKRPADDQDEEKKDRG